MDEIPFATGLLLGFAFFGAALWRWNLQHPRSLAGIRNAATWQRYRPGRDCPDSDARPAAVGPARSGLPPLP